MVNIILLILELAIWLTIGIFNAVMFRRKDCPKEEITLEYWFVYSMMMLGLISQLLGEVIK